MTTTTAATNPNLDPLALPLNGSSLIEASAGTGKTFTIAILYVPRNCGIVFAHGSLRPPRYFPVPPTASRPLQKPH